MLTGSHFVYTSGMHGTSYVNMRAVAHQADWLDSLGLMMSDTIDQCEIDIIVGPETLGRTLATQAAGWASDDIPAVWCNFIDVEGAKVANFDPKLDFGRLITPGTRVAIVDDLLTTGSSLMAVSELIKSLGGVVVVAIVVVRRTPNVTAADVGADDLVVLADIEGITVFTPEECAATGPCSQRVPMVLRPGHGHEWVRDNPGYPTA